MSADAEALPPDLIIEEGRAARARIVRRRRLAAIGISSGVTIVWLIYVTASGQWERVLDNYVAAITMVFGSFVAGSTPQGGGAVAFPVFTKVLEVPSEIARTFSLSIQTVGMGAASAAIIIGRRRVEWRVVGYGLPAAMVGFLIAVGLFGKGDQPFRPPTIPAAYIKVSFTLVVAAMAFITYLGSRIRIREVKLGIPKMNARMYAALLVTGLIGGFASGLIGSGADVLIFLFMAILLALDPQVGVPTSVIVMTGVSVLGLVLLGLVDGQLSVLLTPDGADVAEVGGRAVFNSAPTGAVVNPTYGAGTALPSSKADLFGLWLAAVPVVAWGAPLGSVVAARLKTRQLVTFVVTLAVIETVSTVILVDGLVQEPDPALIGYALGGALVVGVGLWWVAKNRRQIFGLEGFRVDHPITRSRLDLSEDYRDALKTDEQAEEPDE